MNDFPFKNNQDSEKDIPLEVTSFTVGGFKSFKEAQTIDFKGLTILAGTNSSGKSSFMQSLLLLKQTLESGNPANLFKIYGDIVKFNDYKEIINTRKKELRFNVSFNMDIKLNFEYSYSRKNLKPSRFYLGSIKSLFIDLSYLFEEKEDLNSKYYFIPMAFFDNEEAIPYLGYFMKFLKSIIHIKGTRLFETKSFLNEPYFDSQFPGNFDNYVASIIYNWQNNKEMGKLKKLISYLSALKIANAVEASKVNDAFISLKVKVNSSDYSAHIADVGVGVSQVLPILVALVEATPDNLIYIEQPEIHLHPNAQYKLASIFADAVKEGKRLVIETHSSILLTGIQTAIAKGELDNTKVGFNWFELENGATKITSVVPDERGRVGDWPTDFDSVYLRADTDYLNASVGLKFKNLNGISED